MIDKNYFESGPVGEGLMRDICVKEFLIKSQQFGRDFPSYLFALAAVLFGLVELFRQFW